ncbi:MAG: polysaccharide deacetylase family protein [Bacteroidales bacterium]|nr:polysaccharide deacetylase family protein [Bacteroidales bacterium]
MKQLIYHKYNILPDLLPITAGQKLTGVKILYPFYHTVSDTPLPHLGCLYKVRTTTEFIKDIDFFLKHFQPLTLNQLIGLVHENRQPEKPSFFLSFDDGLREFHDVIAPILLKKGVHATGFLNSAFIDNRDLFYRYKACLLLNEINTRPKNLLPAFKKWSAQKGHPSMAPEKFLMNLSFPDRLLLDELASVLGFDFQCFLKEQQPYLTTIQINSLISKGFTFGSHSINHPAFSHILPVEQIQQVTGSTLEIVKKFNLSYRTFSFPFTDYGIGHNFFVNINKAVNFDLTFGCAGMKTDMVKNHLQRIPVEEYNITAEKRIKRDYFYYLIKKLLNKNMLLRGE